MPNQVCSTAVWQEGGRWTLLSWYRLYWSTSAKANALISSLWAISLQVRSPLFPGICNFCCYSSRNCLITFKCIGTMVRNPRISLLAVGHSPTLSWRYLVQTPRLRHPAAAHCGIIQLCAFAPRFRLAKGPMFRSRKWSSLLFSPWNCPSVSRGRSGPSVPCAGGSPRRTMAVLEVGITALGGKLPFERRESGASGSWRTGNKFQYPA